MSQTCNELRGFEIVSLTLVFRNITLVRGLRRSCVQSHSTPLSPKNTCKYNTLTFHIYETVWNEWQFQLSLGVRPRVITRPLASTATVIKIIYKQLTLTYLHSSHITTTNRINVTIRKCQSAAAGSCDSVTNQCRDRATLQGVRIPSAILKIVFAIFYLPAIR